MKTLGELAAAAARELRHSHLPEDRSAIRAFAGRINHMVGTMNGFNANRWRTISKKMGEKLAKDIDVYLWACGIAGEVSLLAISTQHQIDECHLAKNIRKLCRVVRDVTRVRSMKKR